MDMSVDLLRLCMQLRRDTGPWTVIDLVRTSIVKKREQRINQRLYTSGNARSVRSRLSDLIVQLWMSKSADSAASRSSSTDHNS